MFHICGLTFVFARILAIYVCLLKKQKYIINCKERKRFWDVERVISEEIERLGVDQHEDECDPRDAKVILPRNEKRDPC